MEAFRDIYHQRVNLAKELAQIPISRLILMNLRNIFRRCFLLIIVILIFLAYILFPSQSALGNIPLNTCGTLCSSPIVISSFSSRRACEPSLLIYYGAPYFPTLRSPLFPHEVSDPRSSDADRLLNQLIYIPSHISSALRPPGAIRENLAAGPQSIHIPPLIKGREVTDKPAVQIHQNQNGGPIDLKAPSSRAPIHVLAIRGLIERFEGLKSGELLSKECPVWECVFTEDLSLVSTAEVLLWRNVPTRAVLPAHANSRPANQLWVFAQYESPYSTADWSAFRGLINWTVSYRWDSTIPDPYYRFYPDELTRPHGSIPRLKSPTKNYAAGRTKMVAMVVSNCRENNGRLKYARELAKYIQVDIYGACGTMSCSRAGMRTVGSDDCLRRLALDYRFYLAFENSNCRDYISEKFFRNALGNDMVPIVMGAHPDDYLRLAPPHSFLHVDWFASPRHLAEHLKLLASNPTAYNRFFEWKGTGAITEAKVHCRICALAHEVLRGYRIDAKGSNHHLEPRSSDSEVGPRMYYPDVESWWRCDPGEAHAACIGAERWIPPERANLPAEFTIT